MAVQVENFGPTAEEGQTYQPIIAGHGPAGFLPMDGIQGCFYKPIGGKVHVGCHPARGQESQTERLQIESECAAAPLGDAQNGTVKLKYLYHNHA